MPELCNMLKTAWENLLETPKPTMVMAASKDKGKQKSKGKKGTLNPRRASKRRVGLKRLRSPMVSISNVVRKGNGNGIEKSTLNH